MFITFLFILVIIIIGLIIRQSNRIKSLEEQVRELFIQQSEFRKQKKEDAIASEQKKEKSLEKIHTEIYKEVKKPPIVEIPVVEKPPVVITEEKKVEEVIVNKEVPVPVIEEKKKEEKDIFIPEPPQETFTPKPRRTNAEWEALIGGKILNRIGALALIIGTGFFLKYAVDNNWITQTMRVIIGFATGLALLFGGHYYQRKDFKIFSQGLVGAGLAILYLAAYASFNYYHLVSQTIAILLMSAVTVITFTQAFKYDSIIIALFGWLGGFLTPILMSTGHANETGLFTYIAILDAGLLIIVLRKEKWRALEPLTLVATILMYVAWNTKYHSESAVWTSVSFLTIFWGLFLTMELLRIYRKEKKIDIIHQLISTGNAVFYFLAVYDMIDAHHHSLTAPYTVILAAVYFGVYLFTLKHRADDEPLLIRYLLSAILLSVIASAIQYRDFDLVIAWTVEALALTLLATRFRNVIVTWCALALFTLAFLYFFFVPDAFQIPSKEFHLLWNERTLALAVMMISAVIAAIYKQPAKLFSTTSVNSEVESSDKPLVISGTYYSSPIISQERGEGIPFSQLFNAEKLTIVYTCAAVLFLFMIVTLETKDFMLQLMSNAEASHSMFYWENIPFVLCIEWMMLSLPLLFFGFRKSNHSLFICGIILAAITFPFLAISSITEQLNAATFITLFNFRTLSLLFVSGCFFIEAKWTEKRDFYPWFKMLVYALRMMMVILIFVFITRETSDYFNHLIAINNEQRAQFFSDYLPFILCIDWILLSMPLLFYGLRKGIPPYVDSGLILSGITFLFAITKVLTVYLQPETFVLAFNIRALSLVLTSACLFLQIRWMLKKEFYPWLPMAVYVTRIMMVILIFTFITSETRDLFNKLGSNSTPQQFDFYAQNLPYVLCAEWMALSLVLLFFGLRKEIAPFIQCSLLLIIIALVASCGALVMYSVQIETFIPVFNFRALALLFTSLCLYVQARWMDKKEFYFWFPTAVNVMRVILVTLIFIFITAETYDVFEKKIFNSGEEGKTGSPLIKNLRNLQQLCISGAWLFYSMLLMVIGIYRSRLNIRIVAIIVFGITIAKVFFYDLSYLDTLHRIFSFIALGVILLLVSYLYQRYKHLILPEKK